MNLPNNAPNSTSASALDNAILNLPEGLPSAPAPLIAGQSEAKYQNTYNNLYRDPYAPGNASWMRSQAGSPAGSHVSAESSLRTNPSSTSRDVLFMSDEDFDYPDDPDDLDDSSDRGMPASFSNPNFANSASMLERARKFSPPPTGDRFYPQQLAPSEIELRNVLYTYPRETLETLRRLVDDRIGPPADSSSRFTSAFGHLRDVDLGTLIDHIEILNAFALVCTDHAVLLNKYGYDLKPTTAAVERLSHIMQLKLETDMSGENDMSSKNDMVNRPGLPFQAASVVPAPILKTSLSRTQANIARATPADMPVKMTDNMPGRVKVMRVNGVVVRGNEVSFAPSITSPASPPSVLTSPPKLSSPLTSSLASTSTMSNLQKGFVSPGIGETVLDCVQHAYRNVNIFELMWIRRADEIMQINAERVQHGLCVQIIGDGPLNENDSYDVDDPHTMHDRCVELYMDGVRVAMWPQGDWQITYTKIGTMIYPHMMIHSGVVIYNSTTPRSIAHSADTLSKHRNIPSDGYGQITNASWAFSFNTNTVNMVQQNAVFTITFNIYMRDTMRVETLKISAVNSFKSERSEDLNKVEIWTADCGSYSYTRGGIPENLSSYWSVVGGTLNLFTFAGAVLISIPIDVSGSDLYETVKKMY